MDINITRQKGFTLTESLIAFTVTAVGLLAVASFQAGLFDQSAHNKARTEALGLAEQKIEEFKHYTNRSEEAYIDDNDDGVMDADGSYAENPIDGQNAVFTRSWEIGSTGTSKEIGVTVAWADTDGVQQSVMLSADVPWLSPRTGADQLAELLEPLIESLTGRAELGQGNIADYPVKEIVKLKNISDDGLDIYQHDEDLLLADVNGDILLTLISACSAATGECTDFVRISGTVYLDKANSRQSIADIHVLASDASHCERWVPSGSLTSPPTTAGGDYDFYNYTCYFGGGWHGNIGVVTTQGLQLTDKVCQGDPTAFDEWDQPVIALRRAYRGMLKADVGGVTRYYSHGIGDAVQMTGHDYVFTELSVDATEGYHCATVNAPMTRGDSDSGQLFKGMPTDFVCLNQDRDGDGAPDYLDEFDTGKFSADVYCPYDPTTPPVDSHIITGTVNVINSSWSELQNFDVTTSDGPGNCELGEFFLSVSGTHQATYRCVVYDWGSGWTGSVKARPNTKDVFCPASWSNFANLLTDASQSFNCAGISTIVIEGAIEYLTSASVTSISIIDNTYGNYGLCNFLASQYRCFIPYSGDSLDGTIIVGTSRHVCFSTNNETGFYNLTADNSPYQRRIVIASNSNLCPAPTTEDQFTPTTTEKVLTQ